LEGNNNIILNPTPCNLSDNNFNADAANKIITQAYDNGANSLLLAPHIDNIQSAVNAANANNGRLQIFGSPTLYTQETLSGKESIKNLIVVTPWFYESMDQNHPFRKKADELWGKGTVLNWRTATAYDAANAIIQALQKNPSLSSMKNSNVSSLKQTLIDKNFFFEGVTGTIKFKNNGDRNLTGSRNTITTLQVQENNGQYYFKDMNKKP
jgi:branched-chain amino acid transport system substrate-binding protein